AGGPGLARTRLGPHAARAARQDPAPLAALATPQSGRAGTVARRPAQFPRAVAEAARGDARKLPRAARPAARRTGTIARAVAPHDPATTARMVAPRRAGQSAAARAGRKKRLA